VKLTTHLHLLPRLKCVELYFHSPLRLYGVVLSEAQGQLSFFLSFCRPTCCLVPILTELHRLFQRRILRHKKYERKVKDGYTEDQNLMTLKSSTAFSIGDRTVCGFYWRHHVNVKQFNQGKSTGAPPSGPRGSGT
jgi:hypothetical protein